MEQVSRGKRGIIVCVIACMVAACGMFGCSQSESTDSSDGATQETTSGEISVYSREDGSGTRSAFIELFGLEEEDENGEDVDATTENAAITNSTSVMMTSVASDPNGIGYISLGSLNDTVKAVMVDGVEATAANVKDGSYKVSRPFNIVVTENMSDAAQDFMNYILSTEGQAIVEENNYIPIDTTTSYTASDASGKVVVAGSSSVTPVMEKIIEAYEEVNPNITVELQQSDSTTGVNMTIEGTCDIGMASRALKDSETSSGVSAVQIAIDGIAVIVSPDSTIDDLTSEQIKDIFNGTITSWDDLS